MMVFDFLSVLFLVGLVVASLQDAKRREIDNWLNLSLLVISFAYLFYFSYFEGYFRSFFLGLFSLLVMSLIANAFYYGRVFAGGDAKLLFALSALFVGTSALATLGNIGLFIVLLMVSGSLYGLVYSGSLYFRHYGQVHKVFRKKLSRVKVWWFIWGSILIGILGFYSGVFFLFSGLLLAYPFLLAFAKALESQVMIRKLSGKELREGDWLAQDVRFRGKVIKATWEGVNKQELRILKGVKEVKVKEGIPFAPAFLLAFLAYLFFRERIIEYLLF